MSEQAARDGKGIQAYRWWMAVGVAATTTLTGLILATVQKTADDVTVLKVGFSTLSANQLHQSARMDAIEKRNEQQDDKIVRSAKAGPAHDAQHSGSSGRGTATTAVAAKVGPDDRRFISRS